MINSPGTLGRRTRHVLGLCLLLLVPSLTMAQDITSNLVLHLPLETHALDSSPSALTCTATGGATFTGSSVSLDGSNDYIDCGDPGSGALDVGTGNFSIATCLKVTGTFVNEGRLANKRAASQVGYDFNLYPGNSYSSVYLNDGVVANCSGFTGDDAVNLVDSLWHRLVHVFTRTSTAVRYTDGTLNVSSNVTISTCNSSLDNDQPLRIGMYGDGTSSPFLGELRDFRMYKRALTATDIGALPACTPVPAPTRKRHAIQY